MKKVAAAATAALAGISVVSAVKAIASIGMTYEDTMNTLRAVSGATAKQMALVGDTAKRLGADTKLTATSAADAATAMTELAKGGLSVDEAMKAARGTLMLAAAAGIEAGQAAELQAAALNAFNLEADQAGRVSDVLANAANAAAGEITDFGWALQAGGAVAAAMGISLEDTSAALGILANNGIKGSDAGTLLKSALLALQSPSNEASKAMSALGLTAYDSTGNFVGLESIFEQLQDAQGRMTDQQYAAATSTLFGADAARLAGIAGREGGEGFAAMATAMSKGGSAADLAAAKAQGLRGAIEAFKSQVETVAIDLYEKFSPAVASAVRVATEQFGNLVTWVKDDFVPVLSGVWTSISDNLPDLDFGQMMTSAKDAAIAAGGDILAGFKTGIDTGDWAPLGESIIGIVGDALGKVGELAGTMFTALSDLIKKVDWGTLALEFGKQVPTLLLGLAVGIINFDFASIWNFVAEHWFDLLLAAVAIFFLPAKIVGKIAEALAKIPFVGSLLKWGWEGIVGLIDAIGGWMGNVIGAFWKGLTGGKSIIPGAIKEWFDLAYTAIGVWGIRVLEWFGALPGKIADAAGQLGAAVGEKFALMGAYVRSLLDELGAWIGAKWTAIRDWVGAIVQHIWDWVVAKTAGMRDAIGAIYTAIRDWVINLFTQARDSVALIAQTISDWVLQKFAAMRDAVIGVWTAVRDWMTNIFSGARDRVVGLAQNIWDWVVDKFSRMRDGVIGIFQTVSDSVGRIWSNLLEIVKEPVRVVIRFINDKIVGNLNTVTKMFGLTIPSIPLNFHTGGIVPGGYSPGRDNQIAAVGSGEAIMRPEWTRAVGPGYVNAANQAARLGGVSGVKAFVAGGGPAFADGGIVGDTLSWIGDRATGAWNWAKDGVDGLLAKGASFALENLLRPAVGWINDSVGNPFVSKFSSGIMDKLVGVAKSWGAKKEEEAALSGGGFGSSGASPNGVGGLGPRAAAARAFVMSRWGLTNIGGYANRNIAGTGVKSDHALGKAIDVMIPNYRAPASIALGNQIASYFVSNPGAFGTKYVIWRDQINEGRGWQPYGHPGGGRSDTLQHRDHVHVSVFDKGGLLDGVGVNLSGKPERVLDPRQTEAFEQWMARGNTGTATETPLVGSLTINVGNGASVHDGLEETMFQLRRIKRGAGGRT